MTCVQQPARSVVVPYYVYGRALLIAFHRIMPLSIANTTETVSHLRCIGCGATPGSAGQDFRCTACGDLLEFFFPGWTLDQLDGAKPRHHTDPKPSHHTDPAALKALWLQRRTSRDALDQSGVWRFRELLPHIPNLDEN